MNDSAFIRVTGAIQTTLQNYAALNPGPLISHPPAFDPHACSSLHTRSQEIPFQLSSLNLPAEVSNELVNLISAESANLQGFIEQTRRRLLGDLSTSTVASNPSELPSLVEAACRTFYNIILDSGLESVRKHVSELNVQDGDIYSSSESGDESDSSSSGDGDDQEGDIAMGDVDEDDNQPMKPGEEVPPLETKYLPIFEALHERGKVLTKPEKTYLVNMTGMTYRQITIWFQNRRRGELKEDAQRPHSRAGSVDSTASSDASGDGFGLEEQLSNNRSDASFDIRSWRLTSALPMKAGSHSSFPSSPTKFSFGAPTVVSGSDTDDTDLSDDSDDEVNAPPGLRVPSLSTSITTVDSTVTSGSSQMTSTTTAEPLVSNDANGSKDIELNFLRPIKPLPVSRRSIPSDSFQSAPTRSAFSFSLTDALPTTQLQMPVACSPLQSVTSNEQGLMVRMSTTPPASTATLRSSLPDTPQVDVAPQSSVPLSTLSPPPNTSAESSQRNSSPTPSAHSASSPKLPVKPLRRSGCAPRPRPPPRAGLASGPVPTPTQLPGSARSSIVLPPSSNPSLATTTLGTLLRPNPPAPKISPEMEDRLAAMAGRMGVGTGLSNNPHVKRTASVAVPLGTGSSTTTRDSLPARGVSFSFGPTTVPVINSLPGSAQALFPGQLAQSSRASPTSR